LIHLFDDVVEVCLHPAWDWSVFLIEVLPVVTIVPGAVLAMSNPEASFLRANPLDLELAELGGNRNRKKTQE
jgi:hypothetical protein